MTTFKRINLRVAAGKLLLVLLVVWAPALQAMAASIPQPVVAIHVSELTQNLEELPAVAPTPTGTGTTGYQWWYTTWRYFVAHTSLQEALTSDGTPYVLISDSDIMAGKLRNSDGTPRYPILISLAAEAINDSEVSPLREYVNAGGFLFVGSSSFTRRPDGSQRGDFALATEMGLHMNYTTPSASNDWNWYGNSRFTKAGSHRLTNHLPSGTLVWSGPFAGEEIPWGVSPTHVAHQMHLAWRVSSSAATVLASGIAGPLLTVNTYGQGQIIFLGSFQPLIGHGASDPTMYSYLIFRRAIEWAFENFKLPLARLSPWQYPYDAAFMVRHDFENSQTSIKSILDSARYEQSVGARGEYYFCTGALRDEMKGDAATVADLRSAVSSYGAIIGSHNGGLKNPINLQLTQTDYDYWHWGPDEVLDSAPVGYANGSAYAKASMLQSFTDIDGWLAGLDNGRNGCGLSNTCPRTWVSPYLNSTREGSRQLLETLSVQTSGEQKLCPFPSRSLSTQTAGKRYIPISLPVSDWFVGILVAQSTEGHTVDSIRAAVDFYRQFGGLINFYGHASSNNAAVQQEYVRYGSGLTQLWLSNSIQVADWWRKRGTATVSPSATLSDGAYVINLAVSGASDPDTAVELIVPALYSGSPMIYLNGQLAATDQYRNTVGGVLKIRVGTSVTSVRVQNNVNIAPVAVSDSYSTRTNTALSVAAPGVLANDSDPNGDTLTAQKVSNPYHGILVLSSNGSFTYTPASGYAGSDSFSYRAGDGSLSSATASVSITVSANHAPVATADSYSLNQDTVLNVVAPGVLGNDSDPDGNTITAQLVSSPSHGALVLNSNGSFAYTPASGYTGSDSFSYRASDGSLTSSSVTVTLTVTPVNHAPVATANSYSLNQDTVLNVAAPGVLGNDSDPDGNTITAQLVSSPSHGTLVLNSNGSFTYTPASGYTGSDSFSYRASDGSLTSSSATVTLTVTPVNHAPVATADSYSLNQDTVLNVAAPGVLGNDSDPDGNTITAQLVSSPSHGALVLNSNGSFAYTPASGYTGSDSFSYRASDGSLVSSSATVSLTVNAVSSSLLFSDDFIRSSGDDPLAPWSLVSGTWNIIDGLLQGNGSSVSYSYLYTVPDASWSDYAVEATLKFSTSAFGGGIGGRLDPATGSHYGAWIYPDNSIGGSNMLKLVKFRSWNLWSGVPMQQVSLGSVGTGWHTLKLVFSGTRIQVYYDGALKIDLSDNGFDGRAPYSSGGISTDLWTYTSSYLMSIDKISVSRLP